MSEPGEQAPLLGITAADAGMDRQLRENLTVLKGKHAGTPLASLLGDVLAGRRSLREVARTPEWDAAVAPAAERMTRQWAQLSPEEREALAARGREELEQSRMRAHAERQPRQGH